jgi:AcrR family transcriptional regulator
MPPRVSTTTTRERVVQAAAELLGSQGYASTSMEQIRKAAGVSNGSLYHLFPDKTTLAAHLFSAGMQECQAGVLDSLAHAESAEQGIRDAVTRQLSWVDDNPATASIVYGDVPDDVLVAASPTHDRSARDYVRVTMRWLNQQILEGSIRDRPFEVTHALWLGPAQEYSRHWLRGRVKQRPRHVVDDLASGAWAALST